jgi:cytochrome d ubiquinol oxidase subunit I
MKTTAGVSPGVSSTDVAASLVGILLMYTLLFGLWLYSLTKEIRRGPAPEPGVVAAAASSVVADVKSAGGH